MHERSLHTRRRGITASASRRCLRDAWSCDPRAMQCRARSQRPTADTGALAGTRVVGLHERMAESLEHVLASYDDTAPVDRAWTIPAAWYTDPRIAELEHRTVWSRTWQLVGRAAQVASPGEYVTAAIAGEPVLVVRGSDGVLRGFFNVCRHHAAAVMTAPCGKVDRLRCPYHGWTYDLAGQLRGVPEFDGVSGFDRAATGLVPLAVAIWEGLVFVHLDPDPLPLPDYLGELVGQVAPLGLGRLAFCERRDY